MTHYFLLMIFVIIMIWPMNVILLVMSKKRLTINACN